MFIIKSMQDKQSAPADNIQPQPDPQPAPQAPSTSVSQTLIPSGVEAQLSPQQCQSQLREKIKQNKILETKNKKLEAKYIELFKEHKLLKKDWVVLTSAIKEILPNVGEQPIGKYDQDHLKEVWRAKQADMNARVSQLESEMTGFKQKMERQTNQLAEQRIQLITRQSRDKVDSLSKQIEIFKKNSKNLGDQLSDFDKKLEAKNEEVSKLTKDKLKLEHMINQLKMKSITDELTGGTAEQSKGTEINEVLALRHQVSELMSKRDQLRAQLKSQQAQEQKLMKIIEEKNEEIAKLTEHKNHIQHQPQPSQSLQQQPKPPQPQTSQPEPNSNLHPHPHPDHNQTNPAQNQQHHHHLSGDDQFIHRQYMKNVFIRYMRSCGKGDAAEAQLLLNIILTMLKFDSSEKDSIRERKKNWWIY